MSEPRSYRTRRQILQTLVGTPAALAAFGSAGAAASLGLSSCGRSSTEPASKRIVLYSSADDEILRAVVDQFEKSEGLTVSLVTDTEATKTTGLVQRLLDERAAPRADVWWSSEPLGTVKLARENVLDTLPSDAVPGYSPPILIGTGKTWVGFARRARVIASSTKRVPSTEQPRRLRDLTDPRWKSRLGIARPQFGTTRAHLAALLSVSNEKTLRGWLLVEADQVSSTTATPSVVRAIAQGEIDAGLTDTDDAWAATRNGWAVDSAFESRDVQLGVENELPSPGPLLMPNTVALVRGGPNAEGALKLVRFLLTPGVERSLAGSDSRNVPVHPKIAEEFPALKVPSPWEPDWERVADASADAMRISAEVLDG